MQKRIKRVMKENSRSVFEAGKFNLELFQYVIDEHFKEKQEKEEKEKEEREEDQEEQSSSGFLSSVFGSKASTKGKAIGWASMAFILVMFAVMAYNFLPVLSFSTI
jgi:hypothetical protein